MAFGKTITRDQLLAAAGAARERGGRPYWLLRSRSRVRKSPKGGIKSLDKRVPTIKGGTPVVQAQWYVCTSDIAKRRSYKLLPDIVHVPISSLIREGGSCLDTSSPNYYGGPLEFFLNGRGEADSLLGDHEHGRIMRHNFSNFDSSSKCKM